jgi:hypothetical protein
MARVELPPQSEPVVDENQILTLNWLSSLSGLYSGDTGTIWIPAFTGLTEVGTATKTGVIYRLSDKLAAFRITITPATNTSAVAGTTYCNNFPLNITSQGFCVTISDYTAAITGVTTNKRIYTSTWSLITSPITLVGILEVS